MSMLVSQGGLQQSPHSSHTPRSALGKRAGLTEPQPEEMKSGAGRNPQNPRQPYRSRQIGEFFSNVVGDRLAPLHLLYRSTEIWASSPVKMRP